MGKCQDCGVNAGFLKDLCKPCIAHRKKFENVVNRNYNNVGYKNLGFENKAKGDDAYKNFGFESHHHDYFDYINDSSDSSDSPDSPDRLGIVDNSGNSDGAVSADEFKEPSPLEMANQTIRKANTRVNELKRIIDGLEKNLTSFKYENSRLVNENNNLKREMKKNENLLDGLNPYEILGFESIPDKTDLKKQFKKLSLIYHPDRGGSKRMMSIISEANIKVRS